MTERKDLMPVVVKWMISLGYYPVFECLLGGYCDLIACKWAERTGKSVPKLLDAIAIELKIKDIEGLRYQALGNSYHINISYAAMPIKVCKSFSTQMIEKFKMDGLGLLGVDVEKQTVEVVIEAVKKNKLHTAAEKRIWNNMNRNKVRTLGLLETLK
jgi:hypothetical protein